MTRQRRGGALAIIVAVAPVPLNLDTAPEIEERQIA
jgi:hypothetical protein